MSGKSERNEQYGFVFLLLSLICLLIIPPYWSLKYKGIVTSGLLTAVMVSFLFLVAQKKSELIIGLALAVPVLIYNWSDSFTEGSLPQVGLMGLNIIFYVYIAVELLRYVIANRVVNFNVIAAAICAYFIVGMIWAYIYYAIEVLTPGALLDPEVSPAEVFNQLVYFSFVTMTTLGYGDIAPQTMIAQHWVVLQAIVGQFYLAILIARLVALYKST